MSKRTIVWLFFRPNTGINDIYYYIPYGRFVASSSIMAEDTMGMASL